MSGAFIDGFLKADAGEVAARLDVPMLALASTAPHPRLAANAAACVERLSIVPFWKEPKIHVAAAPAFLPKTVEWLASRQPGLREVS